MKHWERWNSCNLHHLRLIHKSSFEDSSENFQSVRILFLELIDFSRGCYEVITPSKGELTRKFWRSARDFGTAECALNQTFLGDIVVHLGFTQCFAHSCGASHIESVKIDEHK